MSFDLGVWLPQKRLNNREAGDLYVRLCDGDSTAVAPHPAIDTFYAELTARHPEIDTIPVERIDDHDYCPGSCQLDRSAGARDHVVRVAEGQPRTRPNFEAGPQTRPCTV
jgi:hypothetical protein